MKRSITLLAVLMAVLQTTAQNYQKLTASSANFLNARLGSNMAIDDSLMVVISDRHINSSTGPGAFFYKKINGTWTQEQVEGNPGTNQGFGIGQQSVGLGSCVALSGTTAFIGAWNYSDGAVYVFDYDGTSWTLTQTITNTDNYFGRALGADGNLLVVSSEEDTHVYEYTTGSWTFQTTIANTSSTWGWGSTIAVNGGTIALADISDDTHFSNNGAVYMYDYSGGSVSTPQKLTELTSDSTYGYGSSVAMNGTRMVIGSPAGWGDEAKAKAFVYDYTGGVWTLSATLAPASINTNDVYFGGSAGFINNNEMVIGQPNYSSTRGKAYKFTWNGASWVESDFTPTDVATGDYFAGKMAFDGKSLVINSPLDDDNGANSGSVYVYDLCSNTGPAQTHTICAGDSVLIGGNYYFSATTFDQYLSNYRGCDSVITHTVVVNALPNVTASATTTSVCAGEQVTLTGSGNASSYSWNNSVTDGIAFTPSSTITYTVTGTTGSCSATDQVTVTVNALPTVNANATATAVCEGGQVTLFGTGSASTFFWDNGVTDGVAFTPSTTTTYIVTGSDGTCTNTDQVSVTVNALPTVTASVSDTLVCAGSDVTFSASGASTYTWTGGVTSGTPFTINAAGTFIVTGTDANNCSATDTISVNVATVVQSDILGADTTLCDTLDYTLSLNGFTSYLWNDNSSASSLTVSAGVDGTYTVEATDSNGCVVNDEVVITFESCNTPIDGIGEEKQMVKLYPNPTRGWLTIAADEKVEVSVINELGVEVTRFHQVYGQTHIDLGKFPSGMYRIVVSNAHERQSFAVSLIK